MSEARLDELLESWLDGDIPAAEARELRALVDGAPALRARFLDAARWNLRLTDRLHAPAIPLAVRVAAMLEADVQAPRTADAVAARIATRSSRRNQVTTARFRRRRRAPATPWWLALAAGLLVCIGVVWSGRGSASAVATVRGDRGTIERAGGVLRLGAQALAVADGDVVVADGVELVLAYPDGTRVELSSGARATVAAGAGRGAKRLELERGALLAHVAKQPAGAPLVVATAQAAATVVGTTFRVRVESLGTRLTVDEGRIAFARRAGGAAVDVGAGRSALAGSDGTLALVEPAAPVVAQAGGAWRPEPFSPAAGRPFTATSPYNQVIAAQPQLDAESAAMVARLAAQPAVLALYRHALPVYDADATTPLRRIVATRRPDRAGLAAQPLRVPAGALPNTGSNHALIVLDWSARRAWELYRFEWDGEGIRIDSGGWVGFDGDGVADPPSGYAGGSYLAGLVRVREVAGQRIPHALAFGCSFARKGVWRHPAQQTDGRQTGPDTIPVGARIQLDPALDLGAIPGLTPGERTIAVALQTYGAYCVGASAEPFVVFCERAPDAVDAANLGAVYSANGFAADGAALTHLPMGSLRVLRAWDGGAGAVGR